MTDFIKVAVFAKKCYDDANCTYGDLDETYMVHINMVVGYVRVYQHVFKRPIDVEVTTSAAYYHDAIEDAKQTCNDISRVIGREAALVVLSVTDVPAENRLMKHLLTMGKTVQDYRAIVLKMCDILANATYSKANGSSMYKKYVGEYQYRRPIFMKALEWYKDELDTKVLKDLWKELDEVHNYKSI